MDQKLFATSNRNVQIDQNSRSQQSTLADFQQQRLIVDSRIQLSGLEGVHQWTPSFFGSRRNIYDWLVLFVLLSVLRFFLGFQTRARREMGRWWFYPPCHLFSPSGWGELGGFLSWVENITVTEVDRKNGNIWFAHKALLFFTSIDTFAQVYTFIL